MGIIREVFSDLDVKIRPFRYGNRIAKRGVRIKEKVKLKSDRFGMEIYSSIFNSLLLTSS